jgi:hypothetical protein
MPLYTQVKSSATPIDKAETIDIWATWCKVRGRDTMMEIRAVTKVKIVVHCEWSERVLRILDPVLASESVIVQRRQKERRGVE